VLQVLRAASAAAAAAAAAVRRRRREVVVVVVRTRRRWHPSGVQMKPAKVGNLVGVLKLNSLFLTWKMIERSRALSPKKQNPKRNMRCFELLMYS